MGGGGKGSIGQGWQQLNNNIGAGVHELGANAVGAADQFKNNTKDFSFDPSQGTLGTIAQGFANGGNFSKATGQIASGTGQAIGDIDKGIGSALLAPVAIAGGIDASKNRTQANLDKIAGQQQASQAQQAANAANIQANAQQQQLNTAQQANQAGFNQANSLEDALRAAMQQRAGSNANANAF